MAASSYGGFEDLELLMDRNLHQAVANSRPQRPIPVKVEQSAGGEQEQEELPVMVMIPGSQGMEIDMDFEFILVCVLLFCCALVLVGRGTFSAETSFCCGFLRICPIWG